jgi:plasmid stability protein
MSEDARSWKDQYMLRFPDGMRERLKQIAAENNRSLNAEIIARLETTLAGEQTAAKQPMTPELFNRLFSRIDALEAKIDANKNDPPAPHNDPDGSK